MPAAAWMEADRRLVDRALRRSLPRAGSVPATVRRAMVYSLFPGGKRLRPVLALEACRIVGGRIADALPAAVAIEMIHTYSLIHDDLPALDNDDLRRGRAASHRMFGEAMAILAGDALLTHAFEVLATTPGPPRARPARLRAVAIVAQAAGVRGMIAGQVLDLGYAPIPGLYAAGEMVGGIFYFNYPAGTGLVSGLVFGRIAGNGAAAVKAQ